MSGVLNPTGEGESKAKPKILGEADGSEATYVEAMGLVFGIPYRSQLWVSGSEVDSAIERGQLMPLTPDGEVMPLSKVTRAADRPADVAASSPWTGTRSGQDNAADVAEEPEEPEVDDPDNEADSPDSDEVYNPADHTVDEVIHYIEKHPDDADRVIAAERAGKNRKGIINEFN